MPARKSKITTMCKRCLAIPAWLAIVLTAALVALIGITWKSVEVAQEAPVEIDVQVAAPDPYPESYMLEDSSVGYYPNGSLSAPYATPFAAPYAASYAASYSTPYAATPFIAAAAAARARAPIGPLFEPQIAALATSSDYASGVGYRQLGMLTPQNSEKQNNLLPLMGKPAFSRRDRWNYYAISNQNNALQLPVTVNGKSGMDEYGVDELYSGDTVYVEGYDEVFRVTMYPRTSVSYVRY